MRRTVAVLLSVWLILSPGSWATTPVFGAPDPVSTQRLQGYLDKSYQELFDLAPALNVAESEFARLEELLERAEKTCHDRFEDRETGYDKQLDEAQKRLRRETGNLSEAERQGRHCQIQHLRAQKEQVHLLRTHAIPVAYSNRQAKLKLLRQWPTDLAEIQRAIAEGTYHAREHGDVLDIGIREVGRGQEKDVEQGQEAVRQMKESDVMPPPVESELVETYVQRLGERIAEHSDLRCPRADRGVELARSERVPAPWRVSVRPARPAGGSRRRGAARRRALA